MHRSSFLAVLAALATPAEAQAPLSVRVAATPNDGYDSGYFAQDLGFFTRAGLDVDVETMSNGAAITAAIVAGAVDIAVSTPIPVANAYFAGLPVVIVAAGGLYSPGGLMLCVGKNSPIKTAKDLEGKTIALNALKTGTEAIIDNWLAVNGTDPSKVHLIETRFSDMGPGLVRGAIDAAGMTDPALTAGLQQGTIRVLADPAVGIPEYLVSVWFSTRTFVDKNQEATRRFVQSIYAAQTYANSHPAETAPILAKYSKMDVNLVQAMKRARFADQLRVSQIQPFLDMATKYGVLPRRVPTAQLIYQS